MTRKLQLPAKQLLDRYTVQLARGQDLLRRAPRSGAELDAFREDIHRWDNENRVLIQSTFDDPAAYKAYTGYAPAPVRPDFQQAVAEAKRDVTFYHSQLAAILEEVRRQVPKPLALMFIIAIALVGLLFVAVGFSVHWDFTHLLGGK